MSKVISYILSVFTLLGLLAPGVKYFFRPTVEIDCTSDMGAIGSYASGYLYGLATEGVPSPEMAESVDISSISQKTYGGLQHPIGDINDVAGNLDSCDYIVVYMQDCFDTWYYAYKEINELRAVGEYEWEKFVDERFLPQVREQVANISKTDYADRIVYCLYNECDNAIWFGAEDENGYPQFNEEGRQNFYAAWKRTYDCVKSLDPTAKVGGPGYYEYNIDKLTSFLDYCSENDCMPDVMIYHELQEVSSAFFEDHYEEYRAAEKKYGVELPIIVTEYGCMFECGNPGDMLPYVCAMENTNVYGNVAYWRLANNLCDTAADDNSPNANWWLYRWYADMEGKQLKAKIIDILHSDVANVVKYHRDRFHYVPLNALSSLNEDGDEITVLLGGCDYKSYVKLNNLKKTALGKGNVEVKVEAVYYKGLSGVVSAPITVKNYTEKVRNSIKIEVDCADSSTIYRVTVKKADKNQKINYKNDNIPVRYEFENGTRLGTSYTYDSAYATTGELQGMVGGIEKIGDGVSVQINVPRDGKYDLDIIYGKANDGTKPSDRVSAKALFAIDGKEQILNLENTVRSEFTTCMTVTAELKAGKHEITFKHGEGTYVLDSMLVSRTEDKKKIHVLTDSDRSDNETSAFLAVAPYDGFFDLSVTPDARFILDGAEGKADGNGKATLYLRRGLNYIEVNDKNCTDCVIAKAENGKLMTVTPNEMLLSDGAIIGEVGGKKAVGGISSDGGKAEFTVNAEKAGDYRITFTYSNNREGGLHDYNVDLVECYVTVGTGDSETNVWCRNTMSDENYRTVTANIYLNEGENVIILTNNGASKFNNMTAYAPNISAVTVAPACS